MGQSASKSISKTVQNTANKLRDQAGRTAVGTSAATSVSPKDPSSQLQQRDNGGAGTSPLADERQLEHLRRQQQYEARKVTKPGAPSTSNELDPELVKFLQDQAPLERKVDKEFTSKRLLRESLKSLEEAQQVSPADNRRSTEETPISAIDTRHTTKRTTNFARGLSAQDLEDEKRFGLEADDIFNLLVGKYDVSLSSRSSSSASDNMSKEDEELLRQTKAILGVPTILRDTDSSYVGAWPEKVEKLQLLQLTPVRKDQIMLSVEAWQVRESSVMSRVASRSKERSRTPSKSESSSPQ